MNRFEKAAKETECVIDNNLATSISLSSHSLWNSRIFFLKKMISIAKYIYIYAKAYFVNENTFPACCTSLRPMFLHKVLQTSIRYVLK